MASNPSSDGNAQSQLEVAYQTLRSAIVNLELGPDERLSEALLAKRYGFGRTPIREPSTAFVTMAWSFRAHVRASS